MNQQQSQLPEALSKLHDLWQSGVLTDEEYTRAKERLLSPTASSTLTVDEADAMLERVDRAERRAGIAELQSELYLLDQDWERERLRFCYRNKYGQVIEPTRWSAILAGIGAIAFGIFQLAQPDGPAPSGIVGVLCVTVGPLLAFAAWGNAVGFQRRRKLYHERRERLKRKIAEVGRRNS